jgi:very-short-patch-repair endonuclease/RecA/RadA recombinase
MGDHAADADTQAERRAFDLWRTRLIDLTRRNRLLHFPHPTRETSGSPFRLVDTDLDTLFAALADGAGIPLRALPDPEPVPPDENREPLRSAIREALKSDVKYRAACAQSDPNEPDLEKRRQKAEVELRNRIRADLGIGPRPTRKAADIPAYAQGEGIGPALDLIPGNGARHRDRLQTLVWPDILDKRAEQMMRKAAEVERETGVATLHLALGFLEWTDRGTADTPNLSPLLLLPVAISGRGKGLQREFLVAATDTAPQPNIALELRLAQSFGVQLPEFDPGEVADSPETWLAGVERLAAARPGWKMHRFATLGHFSYARIAMWRDLDPANWPREAPWEHPILRPILRGTDEGWSGEYPHEHDPDDPVVGHVAPILVQDADSSQHSVLIEAMRGNTLVVEGPPGTGKSQTIANLIANALHAGKTVLFVAEKQAALEVVASRLDAAGLGQFCLALHGSNARPADAIALLKERQGMRPPAPARSRADQARVARNELMEHLRVLHSGILNRGLGDHGETAHALIGRLAQLEHEHPMLPGLLRGASATLDPMPDAAALTRAITVLTALEDGVRLPEGGAQSLVDSPWRTLIRSDLLPYEQSELLEALERCADAVLDAQEAEQEFAAAAGIAACAASALSAERADPVANLPEPPSNALSDLALSLVADRAGIERVRQGIAAIEAARAARERLAAAGLDPARIEAEELHDVHVELRDLLSDSSTVGSIDFVIGQTRQHKAALLQQAPIVATLCRLLGLADDPPCEALRAACAGAARIAAAPPSVRAPGADRLRDRTQVLAHAAETAIKLQSRRKALAAKFRPAETTADGLRIAADTLESASPILGWLSGSVRRASAVARAGWQTTSMPGRAGIAAVLRNWAALLDESDSFDADPRHRAWADSQLPAWSADWAAIVAAHASWAGELAQELAAWPLMKEAIVEADSTRLDSLASLARKGAELAAAIAGSSGTWHACLADIERRIEAAEQVRNRISLLSLRPDLPVGDLPGLVASLHTFRSALTVLADASWRTLLDVHDAGEATDLYAVRATVQAVEDALAALPERPARLLGSDRVMLVAKACRVGEARRALVAAAAALAPLGLDLRPESPFAELRADLGAMLAARHALPGWLRAASDMEACQRDPLAALVLGAFVASGAAPVGLAAGAEWLVVGGAVQRYARANRAVMQRSGSSLDSLRRQYAEADFVRLREDAVSTAIALHGRPVPRGAARGQRKTWTDAACLDNEFGKRSRLLPLRQLLDRAGGAIRAMTPCLMMSPLTVAQFLKPGGQQFDLVIMDEASQIRPEDALGALLRAKQAVIVGDTQQLPPTNFFNRALADSTTTEDEDDDAPLPESVLDVARQAFRPPRMLSWHYRSRHQSLIAFSNLHFYRNRLVIFPSPDAESAVRLHQVEGVWHESRNEIEADAVIEAARRLIHEDAERSIGIVAMNADQKEVIEGKWAKLLETDALCARYANDWDEREAPFVKNLENVQGDERDVILISLGWGKPPGGDRPHQRFYPLNLTGGERRLNVLITRARRRLDVFASLRPEEIVIGERTSRGVQVLRAFLEYARDGRVDPGKISGGDAESAFERSVAAALRARGHVVDCQVGVASYRLDLAVRDPHAPERYLVGIECDGAMYHRARSARDRDRLRQQVLERLGWKLLRVWSTDWYRARPAEIERLDGELRKLAAAAQATRSARPASESSALPEISSAPDAPPPSPSLVRPPLLLPPPEVSAAEPPSVPELPLRLPPPAAPPLSRSRFQETAAAEDAVVKALQHYRDSVLAVEFPNSEAARGLLRRGMITALVEARLTEPEDFISRIPLRLREKTDSAQLRHLARICDIIARHLETTPA